LAVIDSPELAHQQEQARATYQQSRAATLGVMAGKGRAQADVAQSTAGVERARSDARQAEAVVARARVDQARAEAEVVRLQALVQEAEADVAQATELQSAAQSDVDRWQQQIRAAQATQKAAQSGLEKAQSDVRLQELTYNRLKAVQDKDPGLIPAQRVDEAKARLEAAQSDVDSARNRLEATKQDVATAEGQRETARRSALAAGRKVDSAKSRAQAAREAVKVAHQGIEAARQQVKVTEAQVDSAKQQVAVAEAQRKSYGAQVKVAEAQIGVAREQASGNRSALATAASLADYTRITAPFSGIVTERLADAGSFVQNAGTNQAGARGIVKIVNDRMLRVLIPVPEAELSSIRKGRVAVIHTSAYPKEEFHGTVTRFAGGVDPRSRTILTEVDLGNAGGRLRPGMYARVTLTLATHAKALSIPSEAVMGKEDRSVYVVENGKAVKRPVEVGVDDGKMAEITSGLTPAAQVVLVGRDSLVDGAPVKAEPAKLEPAKK
jgi:RND family efflux transporter MFP subunit